MFVNFENVVNSTRRKLPFGIAQNGKSFRNEITPGNFIFRMLEFEQMEMEYFCYPEQGQEPTNTGATNACAGMWTTRNRSRSPALSRASAGSSVALLLGHDRHRVPVSRSAGGSSRDRLQDRLSTFVGT